MTRRDLLSAGGALLTVTVTPDFAQSSAPAKLPKLGYATDALEPFIDARTMEIHHGKHHQTYVDNVNKALEGYPDLAAKPLQELLADLSKVPEPIRAAVRNSGGGHANHSLFWQILGKDKGAPKGKLAAALAKSFGSQSAMEAKLRATGLTVFGSGWVWVTPGAAKDTLTIETSPNQDSPWNSGRTPLLGLDVWEHAYYLKYQNRRADYLAALLQVVNWDFVSQRYEELVK